MNSPWKYWRRRRYLTNGNMASYVQFIKKGDVMTCGVYTAVILLCTTYKFWQIFCMKISILWSGYNTFLQEKFIKKNYIFVRRTLSRSFEIFSYLQHVWFLRGGGEYSDFHMRSGLSSLICLHNILIIFVTDRRLTKKCSRTG